MASVPLSDAPPVHLKPSVVQFLHSAYSCPGIGQSNIELHKYYTQRAIQRAYYSIGDYERCVRYSSLGESLTNKFASPASKHLLIINFFNNRINAMIAMNELERSEQELHNKIDEFIATGKENDCGPFYNLLSKISRYRYHYDDALKFLSKSLICNQRNNDMLSCKQSVNHIGYVYLNHLNDPRSASSYELALDRYL